MSSINDPDGLRKGLSALLEGSANQHKIISTDPDESHAAIGSSSFPLQVGLACAPDPGLPPRTTPSSPLQSISGILFTDPFTLHQSANPSRHPTVAERKPGRPQVESQSRRIPSTFSSSSGIPPVPVIPDAFQENPGKSASWSTMTSAGDVSHDRPRLPEKVFSTTPAFDVSHSKNGLTMEQHPMSKPVSEPAVPPGILTAYLTPSTEDRQAPYQNSLSQHAAHQCYGAPEDELELSEITALIHPHSPVQVASIFPASTRLKNSSRSSTDVKRVSPTCSHLGQGSRPIAVLDSMDPMLKEFVENRLQVCT
jgi:hypothetical protein